MKNKIVIFGATGGTGKQLVTQALAKKYQVTAFARSPEKIEITHPNLQVVKGDVLKLEDVEKAIRGQGFVLCALGMPASDRSSLREDGTANIVSAMNKTGVERLICQTSLGFGDSKEVLPWHMKYLIVPYILKHAFLDHEAQEGVIEKSKINWTIVRPGNMTNGKRTGNYKHGFQPTEKIKLKVSRADVADFMLSQIESPQYIHQKVGVSY